MAHDIGLITSNTNNEYVEGWNDSTPLDPYDVTVGGTQTGPDVTTHDGNKKLRWATTGSGNADSFVVLNLSDTRVKPVTPNTNITGETNILMDSDAVGGLGAIHRSGINITNENGDSIIFSIQHADGSNKNYGLRIHGEGVDNVIDADSRFQSDNVNDISTEDNISYYIDLATGQAGVSTDGNNRGVLTTDITGSYTGSVDTVTITHEYQYSEGSSGSFGDTKMDYTNITGLEFEEQFEINGTVKTIDDTPIENANVTLSTGKTTTTDSNGQYSMDVFPGSYDVTGNKTGFQDNTTSVTVNDSDVTQDIILQSKNTLVLDTVSFLEHGDTAPYSVTFRYSVNGTGIDVTDNATVTSADPANLSVNTSSNRVEATGDTSVNKKILVTASYRNTTDSQNVTVATLEMENLDILPSSYRFSVLVGDPGGFGGTELTFFVLIIATLLGAYATHISTAFSGLGVGLVVMIVGYAGGFVSAGIVLVSLWMTIFIGLNISSNLEFPTR